MKLRACSEGPMEVLCGGMGARPGGCSHKAMKMSFINTRNLFASNIIKQLTPKRRDRERRRKSEIGDLRSREVEGPDYKRMQP